jgi:hypothetical protein
MNLPKQTISAAFAWLEQTATNGTATPTDDQIVERYRLTSVDAARSLLATLAEQGKITLMGAGRERQIIIGKPERKPFVGERPTRVIVTPAAREAKKDTRSNVDKMREIAKSRLASARADLGAPPKATPAPEPKPAPVAPAVAKAADDAAAAAGRKQISFYVPAAAHLQIVRRANGRSVAAYMADEVLAMLSGTAQPTNVKPMVPAEVTAAAIRDDMPVAAFVRMLIARGFASYEVDAARERAA